MMKLGGFEDDACPDTDCEGTLQHTGCEHPWCSNLACTICDDGCDIGDPNSECSLHDLVKETS